MLLSVIHINLVFQSDNNLRTGSCSSLACFGILKMWNHHGACWWLVIAEEKQLAVRKLLLLYRKRTQVTSDRKISNRSAPWMSVESGLWYSYQLIFSFKHFSVWLMNSENPDGELIWKLLYLSKAWSISIWNPKSSSAPKDFSLWIVSDAFLTGDRMDTRLKEELQWLRADLKNGCKVHISNIDVSVEKE